MEGVVAEKKKKKEETGGFLGYSKGKGKSKDESPKGKSRGKGELHEHVIELEETDPACKGSSKQAASLVVPDDRLLLLCFNRRPVELFEALLA